MHRVLHAFLLIGCLLSIFACFLASSHQAVAGSRRAGIHRSEPANRKILTKGYMDGRIDGYDTGLAACDVGHRRETFGYAPSVHEDSVSYSRGYDEGYETGYRIGEYECKPKKGGDEKITPVVTNLAV